MKWRTDSAVNATAAEKGGRYGKWSDASSEAPQKGVFRPLSSYRESWNPEEGMAASGVFRTLSEDGPPTTPRDMTTTVIYSAPSEDTVRIESDVTRQSESQKVRTSSNVANKPQISGTKDSRTNSVADKRNGNERPVLPDVSSELSERSCIKKLDLSEATRVEGEPSGDSTHYNFHPPGAPGSASETLAANSSRYLKLEPSSSLSSTGESQGMNPAARDTGQQRGFGSSGVSPLSRASSPGTNSSSGSSYNLSSTTETTGDSRGPRATPMGSTTGLLSDNSSSCSQSKPKVDGGCMPGLSATLTILSLAASLGNVLRLPRVVYLSGGGTFLVVYVCISVVFGIPLVFLEIGLGQFCQEGTTKLWRAVPLFKGIGYVKVLASGLLSIYYPLLMGLSVFYLVWCLKGPIPFTECPEPFTPTNGEECLQHTFLKSVDEDTMWFGVSVAFLFLLWALFMLCIFRSEHSYRASVYLIFAPVIVCLVTLLVQSILSDSSVHGLQKLVTFQWDCLLDIKVWYFATVQMFFSTHLGFGNIVTCAGRLYSKKNALWTAVSYVVSNLMIGILTVCIVYQWIGQRRTDNVNINIPEGFMYTLTYDVAVNYMGNLKQLWSALTFFTIICTGFIAMVAVLYTILVAVTLEVNKRWSWWVVAGCICITGFLTGIICIIPHNMEVVHILDHYVIGRMVIASTALELVAFAWIYGSNTLYNDFEFVLGRKLNPIWKIIWLITPFLLIVVEIWSMVSLPLTGFPGKASDPVWVYVTGWVLYLSTWVIVISAAIQQVSSQVDYNLSQKFLSTLKPSRNWGPVDTIYRHWWVQWRVTCTKTGQRDFTFKRRGTKDYTSSVQKYHTAEPVGIYKAKPSSVNGTLQHNRATDRGPFTIQANGDLPEHVCWRGTLQQGGDGT